MGISEPAARCLHLRTSRCLRTRVYKVSQPHSLQTQQFLGYRSHAEIHCVPVKTQTISHQTGSLHSPSHRAPRKGKQNVHKASNWAVWELYGAPQESTTVECGRKQCLSRMIKNLARGHPTPRLTTLEHLCWQPLSHLLGCLGVLST